MINKNSGNLKQALNLDNNVVIKDLNPLYVCLSIWRIIVRLDYDHLHICNFFELAPRQAKEKVLVYNDDDKVRT